MSVNFMQTNNFNFKSITEYQIEITSHCNAACPQCPRNNFGTGINPHMYLEHLSYDIIDKAFPEKLVKNLKEVFFCGSYGDPIVHPDFLEICKSFRKKNPNIWIYLHTNGGARNIEWWQELAKIINGCGKIDFGIDGLEDTNHLYRKNVSFNKVINNAKAFIQAGGKAQWNFLIFEHNEHQVELAENLSKEYGFENFLPRKTGRFFDFKTIDELESWPVYNKDNYIEYILNPPTNINYRNNSMLNLQKLKSEYGNLYNYFDHTEILCDALLGNKVAINAEGLVLPCNFFNHNLYDARFYNSNIMPGANELSFVNGKNQISEIIEKFGKDKLNIKYYSLEEIFQNPFWEYVINSWKKDLKSGRIFECAMTCGKKLTKVWDQGGSVR